MGGLNDSDKTDDLDRAEVVIGDGETDNARKAGVTTANRLKVDVLDSLGGSTNHQNGTVGTTPIDVPTAAGDSITNIILDNTNIDNSKDLLISFDSGTTYKTVPAEGVLTVCVRGGQTQIKLKGAVASCNYEVIYNTRP